MRSEKYICNSKASAGLRGERALQTQRKLVEQAHGRKIEESGQPLNHRLNELFTAEATEEGDWECFSQVYSKKAKKKRRSIEPSESLARARTETVSESF